MLKKLAKYGNSTTLVIDKAILELLNMNETSIVKLHTDGKSLIITPVKSMKEDQKVSYSDMEATSVAHEAFLKKLNSQDVPKPDKETMKEMQNDFAKVFKKHEKVHMKLSQEVMQGKEYQDGLAKLTETIDPTNDPEKFLKGVRKLTADLCPGIAEMHKDIDAVHQKYNEIAKKA